MKRLAAFLVMVAIAAAIGLGSASDRAKSTLHTHGVLHPWVHLFAFALVSTVAMFAARKTSLRLLLLSGILLLAWGTEYSEHLRDGWPIEQSDVRQDVLGTALGSAIGWSLASFRTRRSDRE